MTDIGTIRGALTLEDLTSQPADRARDALGRFAKAGENLSRKLGSTVDPALSKSGKNLEIYSKQAERTGRQLQSLGTSLSTSLTLPILALGGSVIKAGSDFESSFAGVRKTVNATEKEFSALSTSLRELAAGDDPVPIDVNKLNAVAEAAGQLGIAKGDILAFTRSMADLGETTNLTADEAATATAQFQNIFGAAGKEVDRFGSTLVALGNAGASTEKQILEMGMRIAGAGHQVGMSQGQVLALASSLSSVGIEAEAGGSAISKVLINMGLAVVQGGKSLEDFAKVSGLTVDEFKVKFETDAAGALEAFILGLSGVKESGGSVLKILDQMGISEVRMRDALLRSAGAGDLLSDSLKLQAQAWEENTALSREAEERYKTFASQLQIFWNRVKDVGITLGTSLLPVLNDVLIATKPLIDIFASMADLFGKLPDPVKLSILAFAGVAAAIGPVVFVAGQLLTSYSAIIAISPRVAVAVSASLGPWGLLAAAIAAVTLALSAMITKWKESMQLDIEKMVEDTNRLGTAREKLLKMKSGSGAISSSDLQSISDELSKVSDEIDAAQRKQQEAIDKTSASYDAQIKRVKELAGKETLQSEMLVKHRADAIAKIQQSDNIELQGLTNRKKLLIEQLRSVKDVTDATDEQTGSVVKLDDVMSRSQVSAAKALAELRAQLQSNTSQATEMASALQSGVDTEHLAAIERTHALHNSWLADVAQFGKAAADALQSIRAADYDAIKSVEKAQQTIDTLTASLTRLSSIVVPKLSVGSNISDTREWAGQLSSLGFELNNLRIQLGLLPKQSQAYQNALKILTEKEKEYQTQVARLPEIMKDRETSRTREIRSSLAVAESIGKSIDVEIVHLGRGTKAWDDFQRGVESRAQAINIVGIFNLPRPDSSDVVALAEWTRLFDLWQDQVEDLDAKISLRIDAESAADLKESLKTPRQIFVEFSEEVSRLMGKGLLSQEQVDKLIARADVLVSGLKQSLVSAAGAGTDALADGVVEAAFEGGEAWEDLGKSIESILKRLIADWLQQWFKAMAAWLAKWIATQTSAKAASATLGTGGGGGGSWTSLLGMGGGGGGAGAASGAIVGAGATVAVFAAIYFGVKQWIETNKTYAAQVTFQLREDADAAVNDIAGNSKQIKGLIDSVKDASEIVNDLLRELGGELEGWSDKVTIGSKGRGKKTSFFVQLEDGVKEWFSTYEEAMDAAMLAAIQSSEISGFSELMRGALENVEFDNLEDLVETLGKLREVSQLDMSSGLISVLDATRALDELWRTVAEIPSGIQPAIDAFGSLITTEARRWQDLFDSITGRQKTDAEIRAQREQDLAIARAELEVRKATIAQRILLAKAEVVALQAGTALIHGGGGGSGAGSKGGRGGIIGMAMAFAMAGEVIATTTQLIAGTVSEAAQAMIDALNAEIAGLEELLKALGNLQIPDLGPIGGIGTSKGGGKSGKGEVKDFIKDKQFELSLAGLSDYKRSLAELDKLYAEQLEKAGKDKKLRAELNALKEKELQLLRQEEAKSTLANFNEFMGLVTPFDSVRKTAADLIKQIEESPFGDPRKGRMIARVLAEVERQIERMAQQGALNLFGEMLGDLEKFGADEQLMADVRRQMAVLEHTLKMTHYRTEFEVLKAQGKLSAETIAVMEGAINFLAGINPADIFGPLANDNVAPRRTIEEIRKAANESAAGAAKKLADELKRAADLLKKYEDDELSALDKRKKEIIDDFTVIRKAFGDTPAVMSAFNNAIKKATEEAYESLRQFYESLSGTGANSNLTTEQQFAAARAQLDATLAAISGGDTSKLDLAAEQGQTFIDLLGKMFGTSTGGFISEKADLEKRLSGLFASAGLVTPQVTGSGLSPASLSSPASIAEANQAQMREGTQQVVAASQRIADVINFRGGEQKILLQSLAAAMNNVAETIREQQQNNLPTINYG